jgi:hypothetical protein
MLLKPTRADKILDNVGIKRKKMSILEMSKKKLIIKCMLHL